MNLPELKQISQAELRGVARAHDIPEAVIARLVLSHDTLIEKVVDAVEESVVPGTLYPLDGYSASVWNECRAAVLEAFRSFRGV